MATDNGWEGGKGRGQGETNRRKIQRTCARRVMALSLILLLRLDVLDASSLVLAGLAEDAQEYNFAGS